MKFAFLLAFPSLVNAFAPVSYRRAERESLSGLFAVDQEQQDRTNPWVTSVASFTAAACLALTAVASPVGAVSGGGLDFANLDITGSPDFAGKDFKGKDFTQGEYALGTTSKIGYPFSSQN
eukprot:scaffold1803_cov92-Amphora_coffeaeformis.AAC.78